MMLALMLDASNRDDKDDESTYQPQRLRSSKSTPGEHDVEDSKE